MIWRSSTIRHCDFNISDSSVYIPLERLRLSDWRKGNFIPRHHIKTWKPVPDLSPCRFPGFESGLKKEHLLWRLIQEGRVGFPSDAAPTLPPPPPLRPRLHALHIHTALTLDSRGFHIRLRGGGRDDRKQVLVPLLTPPDQSLLLLLLLLRSVGRPVNAELAVVN